MQCHKCRYDERNGGTLEERKLHCPKCELSEVYVKPGFPVGDSLTDALIEKESMFRYDKGRARLDAGDEEEDGNDDNHGNGHADTGRKTGMDAEIETLANSDWVRKFPALGWREQMIVVHLLNGHGNKAIHESTRMSVSCIVSHRRLLEQDPYWKGWVERISARQRTRRKRTKKPGPMRSHDCNGVFRDRRDRDSSSDPNRDGGEAACVP